MTQLRWSRASERDLFEIADRFAAIDPDLAIAILQRIRLAPLALLDYPGIGSPTRWGLRKWRAERTPFLLLYDQVGGDVVIRRVVDATSDWQNRL